MKYIKKLYKKIKINVPDEIKDDFNYEILRSNFSKLSFISIVFFVIELFLYLIPNETYDYNIEIIYFLTSNIILVPLILIINKNIKKINLIFAKTIENLYSISILLFCIFLALKFQNIMDFVHIYLMAVMALICFIYFKFYNRILLFGVVNILFIILLPFYQPNNNIVIILIVNSIVFNILSFLLGDMRLRSKLTSFINSKKLENLAQRDSMTGLYNHETILFKLSEEIISTKETGNMLSLLMIDVDNFKNINDNFGHIKGDLIIKNIAQIIRDNTKSNDILGRYGGDEFVIILPKTGLNSAKELLNKLKQETINMTISVKISIGLAVYSGEPLDDFVKRADNCLYEDKRKNRG